MDVGLLTTRCSWPWDGAQGSHDTSCVVGSNVLRLNDFSYFIYIQNNPDSLHDCHSV